VNRNLLGTNPKIFMKGFIHIIEIIIIILVVFVVLVQFTNTSNIVNTFDKTKLSLVGNDILFVLSEKNINWLNKTELSGEVDTFLKNTSILYGVEIRNTVKSPLFVGCICNDVEKDYVESILTPFVFNDGKVEFIVTRLEVPTSDTCDNFNAVLPLDYDVIVMFDYDFAGDVCDPSKPYNYSGELISYLGSGKGVVQLRDIDFTEIDGIQETFFGIVSSSTSPGTGDMLFSPLTSSSLKRTKDYFQHLPLVYEDFSSSPEDFTPTLGTWTVESGGYNGSGLALSHLTMSYEENYTVRFDVMLNSSESYGGWMASGTTGSVTVFAGISTEDGVIITSNGTVVSSAPYTINPGQTYSLTVNKRMNTLEVFLNDGSKTTASFTFTPVASFGLLTNTTGFTVFDNFRFSLGGKERSSNFLDTNEVVNISSTLAEESKILTQEGTGIPALIAKEFTVYDSEILTGRTAWLSSGSQEEGLLLKSIIMWTSGENYIIIPEQIPSPIITTIFETLNNDMFQPIEIILKLAYIF